jgi:hypothetical protein
MILSTSNLRKYVFIFVQFFLFLSSAKAASKIFTHELPKAYLTNSELVSPIVYAGGSGTITRTANLTSFSTCFGTASTVQTFAVTGTFTTTNNIIVLTAPTGFELSLPSGSYSSSVTITQASSGTVSTTVSVRLSATAAVGTYTGTLNIVSSSASTDLTILMPSSTVTGIPTVNSITGTLNSCVGGSNTLTSSTTGGTWESSATGIATIDLTTGLVQGVAAGNATITYRVISGVNSSCANSKTAVFTVNPKPVLPNVSLPEILSNATSFFFPMSNATGSPDQYSITVGSPAMSNFVAINAGTISGTNGDINIPLPKSKTPGLYRFLLSAKNSSTGCVSAVRTIGFNVAAVTRIAINGTLSAFTTCLTTASPSQSFTVTGAELTNNVTITAPNGYEVSRTSSNSGFQDTLVLVQSSGDIASTAIYVRIKATATPSSGTSLSAGNISLVSSGSNQALVPIPTSTINTLPTLNVTGNNFYTVIGTNLTLTGNGTAAASNTWSSSNTSVGTISSSTTSANFVPVANGLTNITYRNSLGCTITKTFIVGPAIPSLSSVTAGQQRNYLRWTLPTTPPTFVDSIQVHRATDSLGTYTKVGTVLNDTSKLKTGINSYGKPVNISQYTYLGSFNGSEYYLSNIQKNWFEAQNISISEGGNLVSIETPEENQFINSRKQALQKYSDFWAGGYQKDNTEEPRGKWAWLNGANFIMNMSGTNFGVGFGEPNNAGNGNISAQDHLWVYNGGNWDDNYGALSNFFVIEYDGKAGINNPDFTDNNLTNGTKYFYKLSSVTKSNAAVSGFGNIKSATPQAGVKLPNSISANTVSNIISLKWTNETGQAAGNYEIHRSLDSFKVTSFIVKTLASTTTSFLDSNLANQVYFYRIKAVDANGVESPYSNIITQKVSNKIHVAPTGNDANIGSADSPLKTISKAIANSINGDTIILANGTYTNSATIQIPKQLVISSNYLISKDTNDISRTIITGGSGFTLFNTTFSNLSLTIFGLTIQDHKNAIINTSSIVTIDKGIIKNNGISSSLNQILITLRNGSKLINSTITNNIGLYYLENNNNSIERNKFIGNQFGNNSGLIRNWSTNAYINNNLFASNGNDPSYSDCCLTSIIRADGFSDTLFIINNTFINNKTAAIFIRQVQNKKTVIANNLFYNPIGDIVFQKTNNSLPYNAATIILNNTLTDSVAKYPNARNYNVFEANNIYSQNYSRMVDTVNFKPLSNFIGIGMGARVLNRASAFHTIPFYGLDSAFRSTKIDIGAHVFDNSIPSPIIDNIEGGDNLSTVFILKPFSPEKVEGFEIYRSTLQIADTNTTIIPLATINSSAILRFIDTTVNNGIKYFYRLKSILKGTSIRTSFSNQIDITPNIPPSRIDSLYISSAPRTAFLTWKKLASPVKYLVLGGRNKDSLSVLGNGVDTNFYKISNLVANTNYWFAVKAIDSGGSVSKTSNLVQLNLANSWYVDTLPNTIQIGSNEYPFNNLQTTIDNARNGDTIFVKPGVYPSFKVSNKNI